LCVCGGGYVCSAMKARLGPKGRRRRILVCVRFMTYQSK
jgi:hypothetical protein